MLCLLALVLTGAVFLITAPSMADSTRVADYGGAELSPLTEAYQLWGWNVPRYYYYLFVHLFAGYPWVVRVAYMVIIFCCIAFILLRDVSVFLSGKLGPSRSPSGQGISLTIISKRGVMSVPGVLGSRLA